MIRPSPIPHTAHSFLLFQLRKSNQKLKPLLTPMAINGQTSEGPLLSIFLLSSAKIKEGNVTVSLRFDFFD
uniref:Uncharacterized protein n=1 Tax=Nelumbo nucifera TaxID=4432 RepID=A0A822YGG3_NELNU|nr:TPA_asm: hypothetical protein HUJ06_010372 [Nelumbo nucifera]